MPSVTTFLLFFAAALPLHLTPGPGMLYVIARSSSEGRAAGVFSILGLAIGTFLHAIALALGLAVLLTTVPLAYDLIRFAGALYLGYLGLKTLLHSPQQAISAVPTPAPLSAIFIQGVLTNVLNPKVALFLLAFLPQFIDPARGSTALQMLVLGVFFEVSAAPINLFVVWTASAASQWLRKRPGFHTWLHRLTGIIFIGLGLRLAVSQRR